MRTSKNFSSSECEVAVFTPCNMKPTLHIAYGYVARLVKQIQGQAFISQFVAKYPVNTEQKGEQSIPARYIVMADNFRNFIMELQRGELSGRQMTFDALATRIEYFTSFCSSIYSFNGVHGVSVNENMLMGKKNLFKVEFNDDLGDKLEFFLDSGFCVRIAADRWFVGLVWNNNNNSWTPVYEQFSPQGSFIYVEQDHEYSGLKNHYYRRFLSETFPSAVVSSLPGGFVATNISTKERGVYNGGIEIYELNTSNMWELKRRLSVPDISSLVTQLGDKGSEALMEIASNGAASTGLAVAAEKIADAVSIISTNQLGMVEFGKSQARGAVRVLGRIQDSLQYCSIQTEQELDNALQCVSLASQAGKGAQVVKIDRDFVSAALDALGLQYSGKGRCLDYLVDDQVVASFPSVFSNPVIRQIEVNDTPLTDKIRATSVTVKPLRNEEVAAATELNVQVKEQLEELKRIEAKLIEEVSVADIHLLNKQFQTVNERIELVLNSFIKACASNQQVTAAAASILNELAKVLALPIIFGPYARELGLMSSVIHLNWNGTSSTAQYDDVKFAELCSDLQIGSSSTRVKACMTVYDYMKGDSKGKSPWHMKETQTFNASFDPTDTAHGSDTIRLGRNACTYLQPYGMIVPTDISVVVSDGHSRKSGCSVVQVTPKVIYTFTGVNRKSGLEALATSIQKLMRSDALAAVAAAGKLVNNLQHSLEPLASERAAIGNQISALDEKVRQLGRVQTEIGKLEQLKDIDVSSVENLEIDSAPEEVSTWIESTFLQDEKWLDLLAESTALTAGLQLKLIADNQEINNVQSKIDGLLSVNTYLNNTIGVQDAVLGKGSVRSATSSSSIYDTLKGFTELPDDLHSVIEAGATSTNPNYAQYLELREKARVNRSYLCSLFLPVKDEFRNKLRNFSSLLEDSSEIRLESCLNFEPSEDLDVLRLKNQSVQVIDELIKAKSISNATLKKMELKMKELLNSRSISISEVVQVKTVLGTEEKIKDAVTISAEEQEKAEKLKNLVKVEAIADTDDMKLMFFAVTIKQFDCLFLLKVFKSDTFEKDRTLSLKIALVGKILRSDLSLDAVKIPFLSFTTNIKGFLSFLQEAGFYNRPFDVVSAVLRFSLGSISSQEAEAIVDGSSLLTEMERSAFKTALRSSLNIEDLSPADTRAILSLLALYVLDSSGLGLFRLNQMILQMDILNKITGNVAADLAYLGQL